MKYGKFWYCVRLCSSCTNWAFAIFPFWMTFLLLASCFCLSFGGNWFGLFSHLEANQNTADILLSKLHSQFGAEIIKCSQHYCSRPCWWGENVPNKENLMRFDQGSPSILCPKRLQVAKAALAPGYSFLGPLLLGKHCGWTPDTWQCPRVGLWWWQAVLPRAGPRPGPELGPGLRPRTRPSTVPRVAGAHGMNTRLGPPCLASQPQLGLWF